MKNIERSGSRVRRLCWLVLWIVSLAAITCYGGAISYGFFFGVTLLPVVSLVYLALVYACFKLYQKIDSRSMVCGQSTPYFFVLQNDGKIPFVSVSVTLFSSFSYVEKMPEDTEYELLPGDKHTYHTGLVCRYRGEYEVGIKEIIVTDPLRLFRLRYRVPGAIKALVKPRLIRVSALQSLEALSVVLRQNLAAASTEPDVVVRDYAAGDSLKQVHWKATAREQTLKVRNRIGEEKQGITLLCDTKRYSDAMRQYLPVENRLLETVLALGIFMAERNVGFTSCYGQQGLRMSRVGSLQEFDAFYEMTSGLVFRQEEDFLTGLSEAMNGGILARTKVFLGVLQKLSPEIMAATQKLADAGIAVVLYLVTEEAEEEYVRLSNERRKIIAVPIEGELEGRI